jgi:hypothetical protein
MNTAYQITTARNVHVADKGQQWIKTANGKSWELWQLKPLRLVKRIAARLVFWVSPTPEKTKEKKFDCKHPMTSEQICIALLGVSDKLTVMTTPFVAVNEAMKIVNERDTLNALADIAEELRLCINPLLVEINSDMGDPLRCKCVAIQERTKRLQIQLRAVRKVGAS